MILVDANLLVYAHVRSTAQHARAKAWLDERLTGPGRVGLPWPSLLAFVRLVANPRVFERPVTVKQAWDQVEEWLGAETAWIPQPTDQHADILGKLIPTCSRSSLIHDAHLAALAIEHGLEVCSTDGDFARFRGVRWVNPLLS
ncbi:MAG TPA: PIN domain-containing protein [Kiritimatiellia bacterium]|nr:PIN domain-containing protein [Kiritimatiellia bacterium]